MFWAEFQRLAEAHPYFAWGGLLLFAMFVVHSVCSCVLGVFKVAFLRPVALPQVQPVRLSDRLRSHRPEASQISDDDDDDEEEGEVEEEAYGYEEVDEESDVDEDEDEEDDDTDNDDVPRETIWDRLRK